MKREDNYIIISDDTLKAKDNIAKAQEYERICEKLGFIPSKLKTENCFEDDNWINPFSILTIEEQDFLYYNGYLSQNK